MKEPIVSALSKLLKINSKDIEKLVTNTPNPEMGDFAFPCFSIAKEMKKPPADIAMDIASKIKSKDFEKVESSGAYVNFFLNKQSILEEILNEVIKKKEKYGSSSIGKGKRIVIDMSSPNIAKPFGIGHLRSTIIGNSISKISEYQGYKTVKINYLGDWGTQFGKLIIAYKKFGDKKRLNKEGVKYLLELYVKGNAPEYEADAREWFKNLESGNKSALKLWKKFREISLKEFNNIYKILGIKFDVISSESEYNKKTDKTIKLLESKKILEKSENAYGVNLDKYNIGFCLIKKADGATLYATRDITAAIDRHEKYKFSKMIYEVGQEQKLHFQQVFRVLELLGYEWARECKHIYHGLYLDKDGKKFATREGKVVFMDDIMNETIELAKKEILKRESLSEKELNERAQKIAISAIFYGDLKNNRTSDMLFDIDRFVSFEGNTGPYLLYTYARAKSILRKARYKPYKIKVKDVSEAEKNLVLSLSNFQNIVNSANNSFSPNIIANYAFDIAQKFNEFYHSEQVIGSDNESFKLSLVYALSIVLKNSLNLIGIETLEKM